MKRLSKFGFVAVLFSVLALLAPQPAGAVGAGVINGQGTISPGIPAPGAPSQGNTVEFTGTATGVFADIPSTTADAGSCAIKFKGTGTDTSAVGAGSGTATCSGTGVLGNSISLNCSVNYTRTGAVVVITGSCSGPSGPGPLAGALVFVPTTVNPTTSYLLAGVAGTTA